MLILLLLQTWKEQKMVKSGQSSHAGYQLSRAKDVSLGNLNDLKPIAN